MTIARQTAATLADHRGVALQPRAGQELEEVGGGGPREGLAGAAVAFGGDRCEGGGGVDAEVGAFREGLAQEPVGVLFEPRCQGERASQN